MKQIFTISNQLIALGKRLAIVLTMLFTLGVGSIWAETAKLTFTAACKGSGTDDKGNAWTITSDGTESTYDSDKGIHYGTSKATVQYIKLSTSDISGTITSVKVNASTASGVTATVAVKVGTSNFTTNSQTTATLSTIATDYTFTGSASGEILVTITKATSAKNALYCKSVEVTYTSSGGGDSGDGNTGGSGGDGKCTWELVTDASTLKAGDEVVIAASTANYALSTTQRTSNRQAVAITKSDDAITINENVQVITLTTATNSQTNTFSFHVGTGFLYASSSSSNELKTTANPGQDGDWNLEIKNTGVASIIAKGDKTRNVMQFNLNNNNPAIFACYSSASQTSLAIYKKVCSTKLSVTFDLNGGSGTFEDVTLDGNTYDIPETEPTLNGYNFVGWQINGEGNLYQLGATIDDITDPITLVAQWTAKTATTLTWSPTSYSATIDADNTFPTLTITPADLSPIAYSSSNTGVATIDADGNITLLKKGATTITATFAETDTHIGATASYTLTVNPSNCRWVETDIANINSDDEVIVAMVTPLGVYALDHSKGTSAYPPAYPITVEGNVITSTPVAAQAIWNISGNATDGYILYPNGSTTTWLYCTASNYNVKVGKNADNLFTIDDGYLKNKTHKVYVGVYNSSDWRHYPANTGNAIANQTLKFYKKTCLPANEFWIDYELANVTCTNTPPHSQVDRNGEDLLLEFTANDGYLLPEDIDVQMENGTLSFDWEKQSGQLTINKPDGGYTGNITITLSGCKALATPTNLSAVPTSTSVFLSWDAVADAQSYEVHIMDETNPDIIQTTNTCEITISGLTKDTYYVWGVTPIKEGFCGIQETSEFTTLDVFTVTFNNQGKAENFTQQVDAGSKATVPTVPTTTGYTFAGWYTEAACTNPFDFSTTITEDITLYAKWDIWTYAITYAAGTGEGITGSHESQTKNYNSALTLAGESFFRSGYKQTGWSKTDSGQKDYDLLSQFGENANTTLYPYWTKVHTITWMADRSAHDEATYLDGETLALPETDPEACQGSEFVGWTDDEDYFNATTAPTYVTAGSAVKDDAIYYAVYAEAIGESDQVIMQYTTKETTNMTGNNDASTLGLDEEWTVIAAKGESNNYPGLNKEGTIRLYYNVDGSNYITVTSSTSKTITDIEITYKKSYNQGVVIVNGNTIAGEELSSDEPIQVLRYSVNATEFIIKNGYTTGNNNQVHITQVLIQTGSTTYANYSTSCIPTYHVNYELAGGENGCADEGVKVGNDYTICGEEPTKTGYTFQHWTDGTNTYEAGATIKNVQSNIALTAVWEANTYTITWMSNGEEYVTTTHTYDQPLHIADAPYNCYGAKTFMGWTETPSVNENGEGITYIEESTNPSEKKTYYAVFADEVVGEPEEVEATLSFANQAQRTSFSSTQQVWEQNGIILTNNKASAQSNVGDYANPARFYAASSIDIQAPGDITKIEFTCYSTEYATNLKNSIDGSSVSGAIVIVELEEGSSFVISSLSKQVQMNSLTVTYQSTPETTLSNYTTSPTGCPEIEVAENAYVTSTSGQSVKVNVPITADHFADDITLSATIEGETNFAVVNTSIITDGICTLSIAYKPTSYNLTESAIVTLTAKVGETLITSNSFTIHGRSLPETFVIATKVGATWYALPANMSGATNPEGVVIDVDETTMTATAPNTTVYTLFPVKTTTDPEDRYAQYGDRVRFSAVNNGYNGLWTSSSGSTIRNYAVIDDVKEGSSDASYEWKITTTIVDGNWQYTLQTDQLNNKKYLRYWTAASGGAKWGTYASGNEKLYFLPVTTYTDLDLEVMEWGTNSMVIRAGEDLPQDVNITINGTTTPKTLQNINGSDLYKIDDVTLTSDDCGTIIIDDGSNARKIIRKPLLVSGNKSGSEYTTSPGRDICAECDIVILNGGKLIADEAKSTGSHVDFANIYVYPGGKLVLDGKSLGVKRQVYLRGGYSWINQTTYALPEVYVNGDINFNGSGNIIYDYYIQNYKYYQFSLPYQVPLAKVTDEAGVDDFPVWVKHYNGALRAANANATSWEWYYGDNFEAGIGYIIAAQPRQEGKVANRPLSIIRFPLGNGIISSAEADKSIATTAHGIDAYNAGTITANNVGWNFIGNPFMATWKGDIGHQQLMKSPDAEHWNGSYHWENNDVKYITVMSPEDGTDYAQYIAANTELKPFFPFYLQETAEGGAGTINFATANRIQKAPAELYADEPREALVQVEILTDRVEDQTGVFISDTYSDDIDFDDYEKIFGSSADKSKLWFIHEDKRMAFEAMTEASAAANIALGYRAPRLGKYTFAINEDVSALNEVVGVYLTDHELGLTDYNLLNNTYEFETKATNYNDQRFTIRIVLRDDSDGVVTGVDNIETMNDGIYKFIYQDKMYIYNDGIIYDATGKQVTNINK